MFVVYQASDKVQQYLHVLLLAHLGSLSTEVESLIGELFLV